MAIAGVVWVPSANNIGYAPEDYTTELQIYANSLATTYGVKEVPFYYAHPTPELVNGVTQPSIPQGYSIDMTTWPKSLEVIAKQLAKMTK